MTPEARLAWLEARQQGISGTDVAALMGLFRWKGPWDIYREKTEPVTDVDESEAAFWGRRLEAAVAEEWARRNGVSVEGFNFQDPPVATHVEEPWRIGTPDYAVMGQVLPAGLPEVIGVLEVKTASAWKAKEWGDDGEEAA